MLFRSGLGHGVEQFSAVSKACSTQAKMPRSSRNLPWLNSARPPGRVSWVPTGNYCPHGHSPCPVRIPMGIPHESHEYSPWGFPFPVRIPHGYSLWGFQFRYPPGCLHRHSIWGSMGIPLGNSLGGFQSGTGVVWSYFQFPFPY